MDSKEINVIIFNKTIKRETFILFIFIFAITIYLCSILVAVPPIIALIIYIQDDRSLKHSFHNFNAYWLLIWTVIFLVLADIYILYYFISIGSMFFNGVITVGILILAFIYWFFIILLTLIQIWYLKMLIIFKSLVAVEHGEEVDDKVKNLDKESNQV